MPGREGGTIHDSAIAFRRGDPAAGALLLTGSTRGTFGSVGCGALTDPDAARTERQGAALAGAKFQHHLAIGGGTVL